jgi:VanZ family protein
VSRRWLPPILWAVFIVVITSLPASAVPEVGGVPTGTDKLVHLGVYAILGWLSVRAAWTPERGWRAWLLTILIIAALAATDEWLQRYSPGRTPNIWDWIADVTGATIGVTIGVLLRRREPGK